MNFFLEEINTIESENITFKKLSLNQNDFFYNGIIAEKINIKKIILEDTSEQKLSEINDVEINNAPNESRIYNASQKINETDKAKINTLKPTSLYLHIDNGTLEDYYLSIGNTYIKIGQNIYNLNIESGEYELQGAFVALDPNAYLYIFPVDTDKFLKLR